MDYIALGRRIKEERLKLNMTQERLAEEVNLDVYKRQGRGSADPSVRVEGQMDAGKLL